MPNDLPAGLPAISYHVHAFRAFGKAYELDQSAFTLDQLAILPPPGMADQQYQQRKALIQIAQKILAAERDKAMDEAVKLWATYRSLRPAE